MTARANEMFLRVEGYLRQFMATVAVEYCWRVAPVVLYKLLEMDNLSFNCRTFTDTTRQAYSTSLEKIKPSCLSSAVMALSEQMHYTQKPGTNVIVSCY